MIIQCIVWTFAIYGFLSICFDLILKWLLLDISKDDMLEDILENDYGIVAKKNDKESVEYGRNNW